MKTKTTFTLVELLVVISIIVILMSILLPALSKVKHTSQKIACINNLKQVYLATLNYANDNDEFLPYQNGPITGAAANDPQYWACQYLKISNKDTRGTVMACPADKRELLIRSSGWRSSYGTNTEGAFGWAGSPGFKISKIKKTTEKMFWADAWNRYWLSRWCQTFYNLHGQGVNMVFADGNARWETTNMPYLTKCDNDAGIPEPFSTSLSAFPWSN